MALQADQEKKEALTAAMSQISQHEEEISDLKQQLASEKHESECHKDQVGELTQTLEERENKYSDLDVQFQQVFMHINYPDCLLHVVLCLYFL